jgi:hypothetical protein
VSDSGSRYPLIAVKPAAIAHRRAPSKLRRSRDRAGRTGAKKKTAERVLARRSRKSGADFFNARKLLMAFFSAAKLDFFEPRKAHPVGSLFAEEVDVRGEETFARRAPDGGITTPAYAKAAFAGDPGWE